MSSSFPHYQQHDRYGCGPVCLRMIAEHYGRRYTTQTLRDKSRMAQDGTSLLGLSDAAEDIGFRTTGVRLPLKRLSDVPLPCIVHWGGAHFVVVYEVTETHVFVADPGSRNLERCTWEQFRDGYEQHESEGMGKGNVLVLEPTPRFYEQSDEHAGINWRSILRYGKKQCKSLLARLFLSR